MPSVAISGHHLAHLAGNLTQTVVAFAESDVLSITTTTTLEKTAVEKTAVEKTAVEEMAVEKMAVEEMAVERLVPVAVDEKHAG